MQGPETRLRKKIVAAMLLVWPKAYVRKIHGNAFQNIGVPDLICCIEGLFFGLEIKCPGKKATPAQVLEGRKIVLAKGSFAVVTSVNETLDFVKKELKRRLL
jgi:hypothetical protein